MTRAVEVDAARLAGWIERFVAAHGATSTELGPSGALLRAEDGTTARIDVAFPPLVDDGRGLACLLAHVRRRRLVGIALARKAGYLVAVVDGDTVVASKVGTRHVQGRSAAGGWSQQRFARRREAQARESYAAAADATALVVLPRVDRLDAIVLGGDRAALAAVLADPRLAALVPLVAERRLDVAQPTRRLLPELPRRLARAHVTITDAT
ncbi:MAG TPA: acVLRF1 family peptidyl-tRNA hydrolase [Actinomycetes bacterium]|nr:acVLRF1 family peptidyl-tRNA hydrolase [Actinomycetes bacterium]